MLSVDTIRTKLETTDSQVWDTAFYERLLNDEHERQPHKIMSSMKQEEDTEVFADS